MIHSVLGVRSWRGGRAPRLTGLSTRSSTTSGTRSRAAVKSPFPSLRPSHADGGCTIPDRLNSPVNPGPRTHIPCHLNHADGVLQRPLGVNAAWALARLACLPGARPPLPSCARGQAGEGF